MNELDRKRLQQLRQYAAWERDVRPNGKIHVLDWAADEIESSHKAVQRYREALEIMSYTGCLFVKDLDALRADIESGSFQDHYNHAVSKAINEVTGNE